MANSEEIYQNQAKLISECGVAEGMLVQMKGDHAYLGDKKLVGRHGTVQRIFVRMGASAAETKVLWHKRNGRGKEFETYEIASDLEPVKA